MNSPAKARKIHLNSPIFNLCNVLSQLTGYDTLPIDSMQGLEIGGGSNGPPGGAPTSPYTMDMDVGEMDASELTFDHLDAMPSPPQDNNQVAAWYDTDL